MGVHQLRVLSSKNLSCWIEIRLYHSPNTMTFNPCSLTSFASFWISCECEKCVRFESGVWDCKRPEVRNNRRK